MRVEAAPARRGRAGIGCGTAFGIGLIVFLVVSLVAGLIFVLAPTGSDVSASFIHAQPGSLRWSTKDRLTILLISLDDRGGRPGRVNGLILVSLDPSARSAAMMSIPPQLWVTIPGYGQGQLGEAYGDGGPRLALYTAESVTHTVIPYYAVISSAPLRSLVDGLGGVQLDVQRRLPVSSAGSGPGGQQRAIRAGRQEVDGRTALDFISFPGSTSVLDTDLMHRQLQLLGALGTAALQTQTGFRIPTLVNSLSPQISTNFPYDQVPELARVVSGLGTVKVERVVLGDGDGAVMEYGTNILVPDWQRTAAVAHRLFPDTWLRAGPGIAVLNGSGVTGQAGSLADWLRQAGLRVRHIGSADSFGYAHTLVVVSPSAGSTTRTTARAVAALLQVPMVVSRRGREPAPVVVIIGHDYQDPNQN